jgi:hypothetical protein
LIRTDTSDPCLPPNEEAAAMKDTKTWTWESLWAEAIVPPKKYHHNPATHAIPVVEHLEVSLGLESFDHCSFLSLEDRRSWHSIGWIRSNFESHAVQFGYT